MPMIPTDINTIPISKAQTSISCL